MRRVLLLALAATACAAPAAAPPPGPSPVPAGVPADAAGPYPVVRVVDGDTVTVRAGAGVVTVRLLGIDTPETKDPRKPVQCFGAAASARAHALLDGRRVYLEGDPTQARVDRYGRTLAYLWRADGLFYNQRMVADGYAHEYTYDLPYRYRAAFRSAEAAARRAGRGLWSARTCAGDTTQPARPPR